MKDHHAFIFNGHDVHVDNSTAEDESKAFLQNIRSYLHSNAARPHRRLKSSITLLSKYQNSQRK
jgi:hypothetical protein